jgi:hypothetical protein
MIRKLTIGMISRSAIPKTIMRSPAYRFAEDTGERGNDILGRGTEKK